MEGDPLLWYVDSHLGIINYLSEKTKQTLLRKSILDIFSDLLYFPYISEIIKAFIMAIVKKPPPEQLFGCFTDLPPDAREAIATKGILHLAPSAVENLMLKDDWKELDPEYGKIDTNWYNYKKYEVEAPKMPYKPTLRERLLRRIADKPWRLVFLFGLATVIASKKWGNVEIKKILARRGFEMGVVLCIVSLVPLLIRESGKTFIKEKRE